MNGTQPAATSNDYSHGTVLDIHLPDHQPPDTFYVRLAKPVADRVLGAVLLLLVSPILGATALVLRWHNGPGVIFRQRRIGLHGKPFEMVKFRTMTHDRRAEYEPYPGDERRVTHKSGEDPRHTPLGRFLRRTSLDELPQLWNVVRGEMSLVGPRPELPTIVNNYASWQHSRHQVKPGMTGPWQISSRADGTMMHLRTDIDVDYVRKVSFRGDMKILLCTASAAFSGR